MLDLVSRLTALLIRLWALFSKEPLLDKAQYGKCSSAAHALDFIPNGATTKQCTTIGTRERCWYSYVPETDASTTTIIHLHGSGGCATLPSVGWARFDAEVIWPQGLAFALPTAPSFFPDFVLDWLGFVLPSWNDGTGLFGAEQNQIDDVTFLEHLVDQANHPVFLSGHSNGAVMAQRILLQTNATLAGVISMSGAALPNDPAWTGGQIELPYTPVPILLIAGSEDRVVPFDERRGPLAGSLSSFRGWGELHACQDERKTVDVDRTIFQYGGTSCRAPVELWRIDGAGHHAFNKGEGELTIASKTVIANCPFRGIPFFYEPDCRLATLDTTKLAWEWIQGVR